MYAHMSLLILKWILLKTDAAIIPTIVVALHLKELNKLKKYYIRQVKRTSKISMTIKVTAVAWPHKCKKWTLLATRLALLETSLILRMKVAKNLNSLKLLK